MNAQAQEPTTATTSLCGFRPVDMMMHHRAGGANHNRAFSHQIRGLQEAGSEGVLFKDMTLFDSANQLRDELLAAIKKASGLRRTNKDGSQGRHYIGPNSIKIMKQFAADCAPFFGDKGFDWKMYVDAKRSSQVTKWSVKASEFTGTRPFPKNPVQPPDETEIIDYHEPRVSSDTAKAAEQPSEEPFELEQEQQAPDQFVEHTDLLVLLGRKRKKIKAAQVKAIATDDDAALVKLLGWKKLADELEQKLVKARASLAAHEKNVEKFLSEDI